MAAQQMLNRTFKKTIMANSPSTSTLEISRPDLKQNRTRLRKQFRDFAKQWHLETRLLSDTEEKFAHPTYQAIIAMGQDALPFIIEELYLYGGAWFGALECITGEKPYFKGDVTNAPLIRRRWLQWGRRHGLISWDLIFKRLMPGG